MDIPVFEKEKTCFFAGHRPYKFACLPEEEQTFIENLKNNIDIAIRDRLNEGYDTFLCGGSIGFDIMCAEAVVELKKDFPSIRLGCMLPFENHHVEFPADWQKRFLQILEVCDFIDYVSPVRVTGCYYDRNQNMIKNSSHMITYFDGRGGGTARVVASAQSNKLKITNLFEAPPVPENITFFIGYDNAQTTPNLPQNDNNNKK